MPNSHTVDWTLFFDAQGAQPAQRCKKIDGKVVELQKAYASVRTNRRNFVGFYADVSKLAADVEHKLELELPKGLKVGQLQGVFLENIETEYTDEIVK